MFFRSQEVVLLCRLFHRVQGRRIQLTGTVRDIWVRSGRGVKGHGPGPGVAGWQLHLLLTILVVYLGYGSGFRFFGVSVAVETRQSNCSTERPNRIRLAVLLAPEAWRGAVSRVALFQIPQFIVVQATAPNEFSASQAETCG